MMLKYFLGLTAFLGLVLQFSCDEVPPYIDLEEEIEVIDTTGTDTTTVIPLIDTSYMTSSIPAAQDKIVVLEDFSGVACVGCPAGNDVITDMIDKYGDKVIGMTLHAGVLSNPRPANVDTFQTPETQELKTFLGVIAFPALTIDRVQFDSQNFLYILQPPTWKPIIEPWVDGQTTAPVNLEVTKEYDEETRELTVLVKSIYTAGFPGEQHNISVFLLESGIIDLQDTNDPAVEGGKIPDYEHNHVVRDMMTNATGNFLNSGEIEAGLTIEKEYRMNMRSKWKTENMDIVAFVHKTGESKEILQAIEVHVE